MILHPYPFDALGTACVMHLYAASAEVADAAAGAAIEEVERIEQRYSRYREDSTLAAINRSAATGGSIAVDDETGALLDYAFACHRMSDGLFDISSGILRRAWDFSSGQLPAAAEVAALLPHIGMDKLLWQRPRLTFLAPHMELDFGGIGKEYAADRAAAVCRTHGIAHGLIDLGGDICVLGPQADGSPWRIGIRDPQHPSQALAVLEIADGDLATSGNYERYIDHGGRRYGHLLNPQTGWPAGGPADWPGPGLSSVSVLASQCLLAGSLASIASLKGDAGKAWLAGLGVDHLWVDEAGHQGGSLLAPGPS